MCVLFPFCHSNVCQTTERTEKKVTKNHSVSRSSLVPCVLALALVLFVHHLLYISVRSVLRRYFWPCILYGRKYRPKMHAIRLNVCRSRYTHKGCTPHTFSQQMFKLKKTRMNQNQNLLLTEDKQNTHTLAQFCVQIQKWEFFSTFFLLSYWLDMQ